MNLKIKDIINCTGGKLIIGNEEDECESFSVDTRIIQENDTYIGLVGGNFNGSSFWKEALDKKAKTVVVENNDIKEEELEKYKDKNVIIVEDTRKALKQIAIEKRKLYKDLVVVGVTGSVGKTTTRDIIANVLSQKYSTLKTENNFNNDVGLPLTILRLRDHQIAVVEMGMNHLGEISELSRIAKPTISVITNVGTAHIGELGSRENILKAKLEILEGMEKPKVIINNDNDLLHEWKEEADSKVEIHTFGLQNKSECMAEKIQKNDNSSSFICNINNEKIEINVSIGGEILIINSLCAILVGKMLGLSNDEIRKGIATFELTQKRMEISEIKNHIKLINDSYNASVDSMKASLKYLSEIKGNRKIAVLGDMFELGDFSEELHRKVGEEVAKNKIDLVYLIGKDARFIRDEAIKSGMKEENIYYFDTKEEIVNELKEEMKEDDVILFKASNGMKLFEMVDELKKGC